MGMTHRSRQAGFSLVELMLALGIGVLVMAAVYAAYDGRRDDAEVSVLVADLDNLVYKANMAYAGNSQYAETGGTVVPLTTQRLNNATGGLPAAFIPDASMASGFRHYWGSQVTLGTASTNGGVLRDLLTVSLENVEPEVCLTLVGLVAPRTYDTRVDGTLVGLTPARTASSLGRFNIRVDQVAPLCSQAQNDIVFRYLKPLNYAMFRSVPVTKTFVPGESTDSDEATAIQANYTRVETAMNARETAQLAIP